MRVLRIIPIVTASAILALSALASHVWAGQRVALVIGNGSYAHAPALANPLNDARDIGEALDRLDFKVTRIENAGYSGLRRGLQQFALAASASEVAVVFYAGHGIEVDRRNFLVPVDAELLSDADVDFEAVPLDLLSRAVERASGLRLIILDACRDNPFVAAMQRAGATRSIGRGLARVEPSGETLVAYAAKEGTVAADGEGRNSPYTSALLSHLEEPGLEVGLMFRKVRDAVVASTGGRQEPFIYGSLSSKGAYLAALPEPEPAPPTAEAQTSPAPAAGESEALRALAEREFWVSVKDSEHAADIEAYLERYPNGSYETLARNRLARLQGAPAGDAAAVFSRVEAERLAAEREFWASVKDSENPDELQAYLDTYPKGTYAFLGRARLDRLAGSQRKSDVQAAGAPEERERAVSAEPPARAPETIEGALDLTREERRRIQQGLASLGFNPGPADGLFGRDTRKALEKWQSSQKMATTGYLDAETAKTLLGAQPKTSITVQTIPQDAKVRVFTASGSTYRDAMVVQPGQYEIAVDAPNHEPFRQRLAVEGPTTYKISLCKLEEKVEKICKDRPVTRTKKVRKSRDRRIEGRGTQLIPLELLRSPASESIRSDNNIKIGQICQTEEQRAKKSIRETCETLGGRIDRDNFRIVRKECSLFNRTKSVLVVGFMVCKNVSEVIEETHIELEKECQDTIQRVRICPDEIVTKLR